MSKLEAAVKRVCELIHRESQDLEPEDYEAFLNEITDELDTRTSAFEDGEDADDLDDDEDD